MVGDAIGQTPIIEQRPLQPGDVTCTYADISKAQRMLDYRPRTPLAEGLRAFGDWFLRDPGASSAAAGSMTAATEHGGGRGEAAALPRPLTGRPRSAG